MGDKLITFGGAAVVVLVIGFIGNTFPTWLIIALVAAVCAWMIWFDQKKTAESIEREAEQARQSKIDSET